MKIDDDFYNYDLIVIGGGINAAAIARDASLRGIRTILIEKDDISSGSIESAVGIIGGDIGFAPDKSDVESRFIENGYLQYMASHLVFRIPFIIPVHKNVKERFLIEKLEAVFNLYDKYQKYKNSKRHKRLSERDLKKLCPGITEELRGAIAHDEWGINTSRLTILNVIDAYEHGAVISTHTEVKNLIIENKVVKGVKVFDKLGKRTYDIKGKFVINATGPWADLFLKKNGIDINLRKLKGINLVLERNLSNYGINIFSSYNENFYVLPYRNRTLIGMKGFEFYGNPEDSSVSFDEVSYLISNVSKIIPDIKKHRIINAFSGIRPYIDKNKSFGDLSGKYEIINHYERDNVKNLFTVISNGLTSFRIMGEKVIDIIAKELSVQKKSATVSPLPGAKNQIDIQELYYKYKVNYFTLNRLYQKYGDRIYLILNMLKNDNSLQAVVCKCQAVTEAEIRYVIKYEFARTLEDIKRRTGATEGSCQGSGCMRRITDILQDELNLDFKTSKRELQNSLRLKHFKNRVILNSKYSLQQVEIDMANNILGDGLDRF